MSRKSLFLFSILMIIALALGACQSADSGEADCSSEEVLWVGLVTDVGEIDDKSFNQSSWEGVKLAESELGAEIDYIETQDAKAFRA